jgi:uroporphyrinogen-III synthase
MTRPRILITRSPHQASALADQLRALGAEPILIPTIELAEPTTFAPLDEALSRPDTFHWLLFTSSNAVEAFSKRAGGRLGSTPKIAAIGSATARALGAIGLRADLLPAQAVAESLTEELLPHVRQADGSPTRFLLVRAETARDYLPDTLRAAGAEVTIVPAYRTVVPASSIAAIEELFQSCEAWPNAITFTSSSTATNLLALLEAAGLELPPQIPRISIGPITSQTLRDLHYPPHAEAAESNIPALVRSCCQVLQLEEHPVTP